MRVRLAVLTSLLLAAPAAAAPPATCGAPAPDRAITGTLDAPNTGSYVQVPFSVPRGTTAIRAWYCHDREGDTLDFGLFEPRPPGQELWTMREFRGWSGSGFTQDITLSRAGFGAGGTTRGYRPGRIRAGRWAAELGVAHVTGPLNWRVELQLERDPRPAYAPARYRTRPARPGPAWFAGDFHVHTDQSGDAQAAPPAAVFDSAFGPAGLDFVQVSDHNTDSGFREWGRYQARHPDRLIGRSTEITTYRGHLNAPGVDRVVDYRAGPILKATATGALVELRAARPASAILASVRAHGGVPTINHPTIFDLPGFEGVCRGCPWKHDDLGADAVEVMTGPQGLKLPGSLGPNPFTPLALEFYERAQAAAGRPLAAVAGSDSHAGGAADPADLTSAPVGTPMTMVFADELSERGIAAAVRAGHTYVRAFGTASPEVELRADGGAIMGDTVRAPSAVLTARVRGTGAGVEPLVLAITRDGRTVALVPVVGTDAVHRFDAPAPGRYGVTVLRGTAIEAVTTPIAVTTAAAPGTPPVPGERVRARALDARVVAGLPRVRCRLAGGDRVRACRVALRRKGSVLAAGAARVRGDARTSRERTLVVALRYTRAGRRALRRSRLPRVTVAATAVAVDGTTATATRRGRLVPPRPR